jgi:hypothetical protein
VNPLAIATVTGFALVLMSMVAENTAHAQWIIIPSQLNGAYKQQQHIEDNNQTKILRTTTILHQLIKSVPAGEK